MGRHIQEQLSCTKQMPSQAPQLFSVSGSGGGSVVPLSQIRKGSEQVNANIISLLAITTQLLKSSRDTQQKHLQISSERGEKEGNTRSNTPTGKKT